MAAQDLQRGPPSSASRALDADAGQVARQQLPVDGAVVDDQRDGVSQSVSLPRVQRGERLGQSGCASSTRPASIAPFTRRQTRAVC